MQSGKTFNANRPTLTAIACPSIGLTSHSPLDAQRVDLDRQLADCFTAIERAGGLPVVIPHGIAEQTLHELTDRLDGVLFSGGGDIAAHRYGGAEHAAIANVDVWRDQFEINLLLRVLQRRTPLLGICRGSQLLNVALGGTLHPEVGEVPNAIRHTYYPGHAADLLAHSVALAPDSRLARLVGRTTVQVNSLHHQAIDRLAPDLQPVARAPDGLIEAVEVREHPFALAVQWHPESLPDESSAQALFRGFVDACRAARPRGQREDRHRQAARQ